MPERQAGIRTSTRPDPTARSVRLAVEADLDDIAVLFAPGLEPYRGGVGDWILDAYLADLLDVRGRFAVAETYVAVRDETVVGSVAFYPDVVLEGWSNLPAGWAGFRALVVDPRVRGAGIGRMLVERCIERARELGRPTLGIHTVALLTDAVRLYERVGFTRCPEFDLRAADVFPSETGDDLTGLAFRYDLGRPHGRASQAIGPRTVTEPGSTT
jgi:GNAT superfamily N-acetyltransferase